MAEATRGRKLMTSSVTPHGAAQICGLEVAAATGAGMCKELSSHRRGSIKGSNLILSCHGL